MQPRAERAAAVEAVERPQRADERLLRDVLGGRRVVHDQPGGAVDRGPVAAEELLDRLGRAALRRADERGVAAAAQRPPHAQPPRDGVLHGELLGRHRKPIPALRRRERACSALRPRAWPDDPVAREARAMHDERREIQSVRRASTSGPDPICRCSSIVETPSFTFRLERVRTIRERAEEHAREALSNELRVRAEGEALLRQATDAATAARDHRPHDRATPAASPR